jgi:hypothetical protein
MPDPPTERAAIVVLWGAWSVCAGTHFTKRARERRGLLMGRRGRVLAIVSLLAAGVFFGALHAGTSVARTDAQAVFLPRCLNTQLRVAPGQSEGALGHIGVVVHFTNRSRSTCQLAGYPGLQMLDAAGRPIPTYVQRGIAYTVPKVAERVVKLSPGAVASFDLGYDDSTGFGDEKCPTSTRVEITAPNDYRPLEIAWKIQPYGGDIPHLKCGEITVSPVFAGAPAG